MRIVFVFAATYRNAIRFYQNRGVLDYNSTASTAAASRPLPSAMKAATMLKTARMKPPTLGIPKKWLEGLARRDRIESSLLKLLSRVA